MTWLFLITSITFIFLNCIIQFIKKYRWLAPNTFYDNEQIWTMENSHFQLSSQWYENIGSQISCLNLFSRGLAVSLEQLRGSTQSKYQVLEMLFAFRMLLASWKGVLWVLWPPRSPLEERTSCSITMSRLSFDGEINTSHNHIILLTLYLEFTQPWKKWKLIKDRGKNLPFLFPLWLTNLEKWLRKKLKGLLLTRAKRFASLCSSGYF